jgi:hypothetical protein
MEIGPDHVEPWINELRFRCKAVQPAHLDGLELALKHRIGPGKRARQVASELGELLQRI